MAWTRQRTSLTNQPHQIAAMAANIVAADVVETECSRPSPARGEGGDIGRKYRIDISRLS